MKNTIQSVLATYGKQFLAAMLTFILLQYSHCFQITDMSGWAVLAAGLSPIPAAILKYLNAGNAFFDTWYGGLLKTVGTVIIGLLIERLASGETLFTIDYPDFINSAFSAAIPTILNFLNPNDDRYGVKK